jgi:anoctamin-10
MSYRRPVPQRGDTIGPWLKTINFLSWLGSLTTSTLVLLFQGGNFNLKCDQTMVIYLLVTVLLAERAYWIFDTAISSLSRTVPTTGEINIRKEEYSVRRRYLQKIGLSGDQVQTEDESTEINKRAAAIGGGDDSIGFWAQQNVESAVSQGRELLSKGWERKKTQ